MKNFEKWNEEMFRKWGNEERYIKNNFIVRFVERKRVKDLLSFLDESEKEILELGCGNGYILNQINFGNKTGVDYSKTAIESCKEKFKDRNNFEFIHGDIEKINLKKKFDAIICSEVLEHVKNPIKVIENMDKHAKGKVLISVPNDGLTNFLKKVLIKLKLFDLFFKGLPRESNEWHIHNFSIENFEELISGRLKIIKLKRSPFFFLPLKYVAYCEAGHYDKELQLP